MLHFIDGNGFDAENTDARWQRSRPRSTRVADLAPAAVASMTMVGTPAPFTTNVAGALGELITE